MALGVIKAGMQSYKQNKKLRNAGYDTLEAYNAARSIGFNNKDAQNYLSSTGFRTVNELIEYWERIYYNINSLLKSKTYINFQMIRDTTTLKQLENLETYLQVFQKKLHQYTIDLGNILALQIDLFELYSSKKGELFTNLKLEDLHIKNSAFNDLYNNAITINEKIVSEITTKKDWYIQWQDYMDRISVAATPNPVTIKQISRIISSSLDQDQGRLLFLLDPKNLFEYEITKHRYIKKELGFQALMVF